MGDPYEDLLDSLGAPPARAPDPYDAILDSIGAPPRPHRDMSKLGADLAAAGAEPAVGKVAIPDVGFENILQAGATKAYGGLIAGTMEHARDLARAHPTLAAIATGGQASKIADDIPEGLTSSLGEIADKQREDYMIQHPDDVVGAFGGELAVNVLPMIAGAGPAARALGLGASPTIASAATGALKGAAAGAALGAPMGYLSAYGGTTEEKLRAAAETAGWGGLMGGVGGLGHAPEIPRAPEEVPAFRTAPVSVSQPDVQNGPGLLTRARLAAADAIAPERAAELRLANRQLMTDPLTGVASKAAWQRALPAAEADPATAVLSFDLNDFKSVNDLAGHRVGDTAIQEAAQAVQQAAEEHGVGGRVFRPGGDELTVLAPKDKAEALRQRAEDLFGERQYQHPDNPDLAAGTSLSGGVGDTYSLADDALQGNKALRKGIARATTPEEVAAGRAAGGSVTVQRAAAYERTPGSATAYVPPAGDGQALYVARDGGRDVGALIAEPQGGGGWRGRQVVVEGSYQGRGIPERLGRAAVADHGPYLGLAEHGVYTEGGEAMVSRLQAKAPFAFAPREPLDLRPLVEHVTETTPPEHLSAFTPSTDDAVASPSNSGAVAGALAASPEALRPQTGAPLAAGDDAVRHWMLRSALGDHELADRLYHSTEPGLRQIGGSIASVAPSIQDSAAGAELRGALQLAARAVADVREQGGAGSEVSRVGQLLGQDAPTEVHRLASFMVEHGSKPEELGLLLHRFTELHEQSQGQPSPPAIDSLLQMAEQPEQRQLAGSVTPLESRFQVQATPGEAGFIGFPAKRFGVASPLARWFTRDGRFAAMGADMARKAKEGVILKDNRVSAEAKIVAGLERDFGQAFEEHMRSLEASGLPVPPKDDILNYVREGIQGHNGLSQVSASLQDAAYAYRTHTDAFSDRYLQRPDLPATLKAAIAENKGTYFPKTFERFLDPKGWVKKLRGRPQGQQIVKDAAAWAKTQNPTWTDSQAEGYAWKLLLDDPQAAFAISSQQRGALGTESRGNLIARRGLPEELDNLLGLHPDPSISFQLGSMRAIRDLETWNLHENLRIEGSKPGPNGEPPVFVDLHDVDHPIQVGGKGPLAPMYAAPEVAASVRGTMNQSPSMGPWMTAYMRENGRVKSGMTALNFPMGVDRNILTGPFQLMAQGHFIQAFPLKYAYETIRKIPLAIEANLGTKRGAVLKMARMLGDSITLPDGSRLGERAAARMKDMRPEIQKLTELGVFGQSVTRDNLQFYQQLQEGETPKGKIGRTVQNMGGVWSGEHDITKLTAFDAEKWTLKWANPGMSMADIEAKAAERIRATMPTRSEVSDAVRAVRAAPLVAPFPTWAAEYWRNAKNNIGIAISDIRDPNPRMKVVGATRVAGIISSWMLASGGMVKAVSMLYGTTKKQADATREFVPDYLKNNELAVAERRGGHVRVFNASPLMPISGITGAVNALLRGIHTGQTQDGIIDAIEEAIRPFTDTEFLAKAGLDLYSNRTHAGGIADQGLDLLREHPPTGDEGLPIYEKGTPLHRTIPQIASYLWHGNAPGTLREGERFARANEVGGLSNVNSRDKRYTNEDELLRTAGMSFSTIDLNRQLTKVGFDLRNALSDSARFFSRERSGSQNDAQTVILAREDANAKWKDAFELAQKKIAAAREIPVSDQALRALLMRTGLKPAVIGQLLSGRFVGLPLNRPYHEPIDFVGQDGAPP